jgi:hypothetical protein
VSSCLIATPLPNVNDACMLPNVNDAHRVSQKRCIHIIIRNINLVYIHLFGTLYVLSNVLCRIVILYSYAKHTRRVCVTVCTKTEFRQQCLSGILTLCIHLFGTSCICCHMLCAGSSYCIAIPNIPVACVLLYVPKQNFASDVCLEY